MKLTPNLTINRLFLIILFFELMLLIVTGGFLVQRDREIEIKKWESESIQRSTASVSTYYSSLVGVILGNREQEAKQMLKMIKEDEKAEDVSIIPSENITIYVLKTCAVDRALSFFNQVPVCFEKKEGRFIIYHELRSMGYNLGYLEKIITYPKFDVFYNNQIIFNMLSVVLVFALINFVLVFILVRYITSPISTMIKTLSTEPNDEIDESTFKIRELYLIASSLNNSLRAIKDYQKKLLEQSKLAAIGGITQLLAHDVRKPFSQLKSFLNMFDQLKNDPKELERAKKEINKSIKNVEAMLSDIMDVSREVKLETRPEALAPVIDFVIRQTSQNYPKANITFDYKLEHSNKPLLDEERIARAFSNIISNGIEAITIIGKKDEGEISIKTSNVSLHGKGYIKVIIGNDGPSIPEENLDKLFDSFFTKGKKSGTGLGLTSAKKIILLHDGYITAQNMISSTNSPAGVEFEILIPASKEKDSSNINSLPKTIQEAAFLKLDNIIEEPDDVIREIVSKNREIKLLLLEDEALYRASVKNTIKKSELLNKMITIYDVQTVEDALGLVQKEGVTHAIVDIDLNQEKDGFDFLRELKTQNKRINCVVHSNRHLDEYKKMSQDLGAKMFVPKPLALEHLLLFLSGSLPSGVTCYEDKGVKKRILYCDDDLIFRLNFKNIMKEIDSEKYEYHVFEKAEELLTSIDKLKGCYAVLTDQNLEGGMSGIELVGKITGMNINCKKIIVSNMMGDDFIQNAKLNGADEVLSSSMLTKDFIASL